MNRFFTLFIIIYFSFTATALSEETYRVTAYCACAKCCGKYSDGHFASGKKVYVGGIACNHYPFGTKLNINGKIYTVEDRGAKSIFGTTENIIYAIDIFYHSHEEAKQFGVRYLPVKTKGN